MISRLLKDKGVLEFLEAAKKIANEYKKNNLEFTIFGEIDEANFNSLSMEDLRGYLSPQIIYKGFNPKIQDSILQSSVVVLPSYREGFSKVLMEAQAFSRPVITSNVTGCKDVIIDGKTGFLSEPRSTNGLIEKMELFISNPKLINKMGVNAYKHASKNFTIENFEKKIIRIIG